LIHFFILLLVSYNYIPQALPVRVRSTGTTEISIYSEVASISESWVDAQGNIRMQTWGMTQLYFGHCIMYGLLHGTTIILQISPSHTYVG